MFNFYHKIFIEQNLFVKTGTEDKERKGSRWLNELKKREKVENKEMKDRKNVVCFE